jgi:hypothetical protein
MGIKPRIKKHWIRGQGLPFCHEFKTVMYETTLGHILCAACASGRNGSKTRRTPHGSEQERHKRWDVVRRHFVTEGQCDHCRARLTSLVSWFMVHDADEWDDVDMRLLYDADTAFFESWGKLDMDWVARRLRDIFVTTTTIHVVPKESTKTAIYLLAYEEKTSRVDGTDFSSWIDITRHISTLLHPKGEVKDYLRASRDRDKFLRNMCDEVHLLALSDADPPIPPLQYEFLEHDPRNDLDQDGAT